MQFTAEKQKDCIKVMVLGKYPCIFMEGLRFDQEDVDAMDKLPVSIYSMRHFDDDWSNPCQIRKNNVMANFFGRLFSREPIRELEQDPAWGMNWEGNPPYDFDTREVDESYYELFWDVVLDEDGDQVYCSLKEYLKSK